MDTFLQSPMFSFDDLGTTFKTSLDINELPIFEELEISTCSPKFSQKVVIDDAFTAKIDGFDESQFEMLYSNDPLFDKFMAGNDELDQTTANEQCTVDSMTIESDQHDIIVGLTVTISDAPKKIEQNVVKSSDIIQSFNVPDIENNKLVHISEPMTISIPPCLHQRARYENECEKTLRYIVVLNDGIITIAIPDIRGILRPGITVWMRITRTTIQDDNTTLIFLHPYPIWMKNVSVKVHDGSLYLLVTNEDMDKGFIEINNLVMVRLKQPVIAEMEAFSVYDASQLNFTDKHPIPTGTKKAKETIENYDLRHSMLIFQLVLVDQDNIVFLTDCLCHTEAIREYEATEFALLKPDLVASGVRTRQTPIKKHKKIGERKKSKAVNLKKRTQVAINQCSNR